jgi:O-antigen/teichoic acid export membrane protein
MQSMLGAASVGIFAALAYFLVLSGTVVGALAQAASPASPDLYHAGSVRFKRTLARLVGLGSTLGGVGIVGAVLLGAPVLRVVFDDEYAARVDVLVVLMVGAAVQYSVAFLGTAVNALRKFAVCRCPSASERSRW